MKLISLKLLVLLLFSFSSNAQYDIENLKIEYGAELPDDKQKIVKILGEANDKIFALALKKDDYFIKTFEAGSMKMLSSKPIVFSSFEGKDVDFEDAFLLDGKPYIVGSVYTRKTKQFNLVGAEILPDGKISKDGIKMFIVDVKNKSERGSFYMKASHDEKSLLVMHTMFINRENAVQYEIKLFDSELKTLFVNTEKVLFDDSKKKDFEFTIADFEINDQKDAMLVISESYRDSKNKTHIENFEIHVFKKINNYSKEVVKLDLKGQEIINCSLFSTNKNTLKLTGFYSSLRANGKANKELKGIFNATVDLNTNTASAIKFNEFDYATKVKLLGERRAKKGKDVKPLYFIKNIIEKEDGGLIVLSEYRVFAYTQGAGIGPLAMQTFMYDYNEIIVTSLKPDGELEWSNVLPKEQRVSITSMTLWFGSGFTSGSFNVGIAVGIPLGLLGSGPEYISAIPIYHDKQLSILINDNIKNKGITDIEKIGKMGNHLNAVPSLFIFDEKGNITRKDPDTAIKNELVIRPGVYYRTSANEYIIYASRRKLDRLGRLHLVK